jgi:iron complex outermembrane receptor protein
MRKQLRPSSVAAIVVAATFLATAAHAQEDTTSMKDIFSQFSLRDLLNVSIVTVSKQAENLFDAPLSATVLTANEIKSAGATSIMEAFRLIPGLIVREQTPGNFDLHIRGLDNPDPNAPLVTTVNTVTLVMVNNRLVYNDVQGGTFWDMLQLGIDDIDRIEVVRGPAAALYGSNAATGVINIITKKPNYKTGAYASTYAQGGMYNTGVFSGAVGYGSEGGFSVRVGGTFETRARHLVDYYRFSNQQLLGPLRPGGYRPRPDTLANGNAVPPDQLAFEFPDFNRALTRYAVNLHSAYTAPEFNVNLLGGYANAQYQRPYFGAGEFVLNSEENQSVFGHLFGNWRDLSFSGDITRGENITLGRIPYNFLAINASADYNLVVSENFSLKPSMVYHGVRYVAFTVNQDRSRLYPQTEPITNSTLSASFRADYGVARFRFIFGLRADRFEVPENRFFISPQAVVTFKPNSDLLLRASYGRSARSPFIASVFGFREPTPELPVRFIGNTNQALLTVDEVETGFRYNLADKISIDLEAFYSIANNFESILPKKLILQQPFSFVEFAFENTSQRAEQLGATLELNLVPNPDWAIKAFATVQRTQIQNYNYNSIFSPERSVRDSAFVNPATPTLFGGVVITASPWQRVALNLNAYFYTAQTFSIISGQGLPIANATEVSGNFILNATASYEVFPKVKAFVNGRNLLGGGRRQFGFADQINTMVLGGLQAEL